MLNSWIRTLQLEEHVITKAIEVFASYDIARLKFMALPGDKDKTDTTYMSRWPASATMTFDFLHEMIYGSTYHGRYKDCLKSRGNVNDMMEYTTIQAAVDAIKEAMRPEKPDVPPQLWLLRTRKK